MRHQAKQQSLKLIAELFGAECLMEGIELRIAVFAAGGGYGRCSAKGSAKGKTSQSSNSMESNQTISLSFCNEKEVGWVKIFDLNEGNSGSAAERRERATQR